MYMWVWYANNTPVWDVHVGILCKQRSSVGLLVLSQQCMHKASDQYVCRPTLQEDLLTASRAQI